MEKLIAVRGDDSLFYTHDIEKLGITRRMGYIQKSNSNIKLEVDIDVVLSRGYWEEPKQDEREVKGKSMKWVDIATKSFVDNAPSFDMKSLNYTKPELRERIKNRIMAGSKGGKPGQWSARKAQLLAIEYREAGGGYRGGLRKTQRSLKKWTREKWTTSDGKPAIRKGGTRRYLPASAWSRLTPAQRAATNRKKIIGSRQGNQFVANTRSAENASRRARD